MLMTPPPALGTSPLYSPASINRQQVQQQAIPGLQSASLLNRGTTGLSTGFNPSLPPIPGGNSSTSSSGTGGSAMMANLLGRG